MWWQLFTPAFRTRLRVLAGSATGREARVLAAKVSPLLSVFVMLALLVFLPGYGYGLLLTAAIGTFCVCAAIAYALPRPFILVLRAIAADPEKDVVWNRRSQSSDVSNRADR